MAQIHAFLDLQSGLTKVSTAFVNSRRSALTSTFAYENGYLQNRNAYQIDPELPLQLGNWAVSNNELSNCFLDSAPDRWGRNLIKKKYPNKFLTNLDYLLEVSDISRQGALRFKTEDTGEFLNDENNVPKMIALADLLEAAHSVSVGKKEDDAVKYLLNAGTASLGGARPKAIIKHKGELWIAKFPHNSDEYDVIEAEYKALIGASSRGIKSPKCKLKKVGNANVLLVKRFDRHLAESCEYKRIGYISAMTALGAKDGEAHDYLEIIDFIHSFGSRPKEDIAELLRRIRYSVEINNTDDHLRNHGFLWEGNGWKLSPVFDINPNPNLNEPRVTAINGAVSLVDCERELEKLEKEYA